MFTRERQMRPLIMDWLKARHLQPVCEVWLPYHTADIISAEYAERVGRRRPSCIRLVAVELKLTDVSGVIRQCENCHRCCEESYAAMPANVVYGFRPKTVARFRDAGVGLLAVCENVRMIVASQRKPRPTSGWFHENLPVKLWRRIVSGKTHWTEEQTAAFREQRREFEDYQKEQDRLNRECLLKWANEKAPA